MKNINITTANLINSNGNPAANQIVTRIYGKDELKALNIELFTSYDKKVCMIDYTGDEISVAIDSKAFDYSITTSKYLNLFLEERGKNPKDIKKIYESGQSSRITTKYGMTFLVDIIDLNN